MLLGPTSIMVSRRSEAFCPKRAIRHPGMSHAHFLTSSEPSLVLWVGMSWWVQRNRLVGLSTWMQRTGTDSTSSTDMILGRGSALVLGSQKG